MNAVEWVDVSYVQGYPNYLQLKADGIHGAIARVNEGTIEDGSLAWNWPRITAAGLARGGYDFAYTANAATFEANEFLSYLRAVGGWTANDILILDIEQNAGNLSAAALQQWVLTWCQTVMSATGIRPWIYSYLSFISQYLQNSALTAYPLWLANPSAKSWPKAPKPWTTIIAWQYGDGTLNGISGSVDLDQVDPPAPLPPPPTPVYHEDMDIFIIKDGANAGGWTVIDGPMTIPTSSAQLADLSAAGVATHSILQDTFSAISTAQSAYQTALVAAVVSALQPSLAALATASEVTQVDADVKALPAPATPGEVLAVEGRVEGVEADVLAGDAAIENVINARGKTKP